MPMYREFIRCERGVSPALDFFGGDIDVPTFFDSF